MKIKNKILMLLLVFSAVLFSGCFKININQEFNTDGSSNMSIVYDMSAMVSMMRGMSESMGGNETQEDLCADFETPENSSLEFVCTSTPQGIVTLTSQLTPEYTPSFKVESSFMKTTYTYDVNDVFIVLSNSSDNPEQQLDKDSIAEMKNQDFSAMGAVAPTMTYKITMPAPITSAGVGTIEGNTVTIDLFNVTDAESTLIVAEKTNRMLYYIGAGVLALIVVLLIIVRASGKNKGNEVSDQKNNEAMSSMKDQVSNKEIKTPSEGDKDADISENSKENKEVEYDGLNANEKNCKEYITRHKEDYSRDAIKNSLVSTGISDDEVEGFMKKYFD
jgi:hypothetical protein